jgi:hypothetical protein
MNISIRQGETLELTVTIDDLTASTVQLIVENDDGIIINETENFSTVSGKRVALIETNNTDHDLGEYEYMLVVTYSDGVIEKLPDVADCEECSLPTLTICKSLGVS